MIIDESNNWDKLIRTIKKTSGVTHEQLINEIVDWGISLMVKERERISSTVK